MILQQEEFAYNNCINKSIGKLPFQILYEGYSRNTSKLWQLYKGEISSVEGGEFFEHLKNIHEEARKQITKMNT